MFTPTNEQRAVPELTGRHPRSFNQGTSGLHDELIVDVPDSGGVAGALGLQRQLFLCALHVAAQDHVAILGR